MDGRNFNSTERRPRILVAPLDWGLGHATRCIPIIFKLLQENCEVIIAAERSGKTLLQKEFPEAVFVELEGYRVGYSVNPALMPLKMLLQFPRILSRIYSENRWLKKIVDAYHIDAVISDNRMGLYHEKIPCIYITHQLRIMTGNSYTERIAQKIHYHFINRFSQCWVPDNAGANDLAGELSHPANLPKTPVKYIGPLSRFTEKNSDTKYKVCIIVSGPEPQRSIFENLVLKDITSIEGRIFLVRGLPGNAVPVRVPAHVEVADHLPSNELNDLILRSALIICRSGYSSIMDLVKLKKNAILVPTPGQTEQEYLAGYLSRKKLFFTVAQDKFHLKNAIEAASHFQYSNSSSMQEQFEKIIEDLLGNL